MRGIMDPREADARDLAAVRDTLAMLSDGGDFSLPRSRGARSEALKLAEECHKSLTRHLDPCHVWPSELTLELDDALGWTVSCPDCGRKARAPTLDALTDAWATEMEAREREEGGE